MGVRGMGGAGGEVVGRGHKGGTGWGQRGWGTGRGCRGDRAVPEEGDRAG